MEKTKILFLASNPWNTKPLGLDEEQQRIQNLWDSFDYLRERFDIRFHPAVRGEDLQEKILKFKPDLIHFSGHGENDSIIFSDVSGDNAYEISKQTLAQLFKSCAPTLKAVFLNACYSGNQADEIVEQVNFVVGMNAAINDLAAISFSQGFYTAVFSQNELNIEQAFQSGLNQMAIAQIPEKEQRKPVLQTCRQTFVPSFKHDVFISFADADEKWAIDFITYLTKQLKQKLQTADGFQLYTGNDFNQLEHSATLMVIASSAYCQQYQAQLDVLKQQNKLFFIEKELCNPRPEALKGFSPTKFWRYDDSEGMMFLNGGDEYFVQADKLANEVANRLLELKKQHQSKQRFEAEHQAETAKSASIEASVFLNSAPEDLQLSQHIKSLLKKNGVKCVLVPMERTDNLSPKDIRDDIENKISGCDAVLVLCAETTAVWASKQIMDCLRLQRKRETSFKIIAIHKDEKHPDLGIDWDELKTYIRPPKIESYLENFIGALA